MAAQDATSLATRHHVDLRRDFLQLSASDVGRVPEAFDLLAAENADLKARLELAGEREFYLAAEVARLKSELLNQQKRTHENPA